MKELHFFDPRDPVTGFLSNFYRAPFFDSRQSLLDRHQWQTVEHCYQACQGDEVSPDIAKQLSVRMIEGATHAFDWPNPPPPAFSPFAKAQNGGMVTMNYDAKEAEAARMEMVDFFQKRLR